MMPNYVVKVKTLHRGRSQYRDYSHSSVIMKEVQLSEETTTTGEKLFGIIYKVAFGGVGFMIGVLTSNHLAKSLQNNKETLVEMRKELVVSILPVKLQRIAKED